MSDEQQLKRIEDKLDKLGDAISTIESNQAADLQRFKQIDERFHHSTTTTAAFLKLHVSECQVKDQVVKLEKRFDAVNNQAQGAWWAGGKIWAAMVAVLVLVDLVYKLYQASR